jgi:hypothetical protein
VTQAPSTFSGHSAQVSPGFTGLAGRLQPAPDRDWLPVTSLAKGRMITEPRWGLIVIITGITIVIRDSADDRTQWLYLVSWRKHRFANHPLMPPPATGVTAVGGADEVYVYPLVSNTGAGQAAA